MDRVAQRSSASTWCGHGSCSGGRRGEVAETRLVHHTVCCACVPRRRVNTQDTLQITRARSQVFRRTKVFAHRFPLRAMHFNLSLLLGIMGVLATRSKDPDDSDELRKALLNLDMAHVKIASLKLEIVHLKEELDECAQGHMCFVVVGKPSLRHSRSQPSVVTASCGHRDTWQGRHAQTQAHTRGHKDTQTHRLHRHTGYTDTQTQKQKHSR